MPDQTPFVDKNIILAVTGSIAIYKAVDLASKLTQAGAKVDVIMTESAQRFITPLTFQSVTGRPVYTDVWQADSSGGLPTHIAHVGLGEGANLMMIAPATAQTMAKLAHGLADNLLTITALAARCPIIVAPAMDGGMYEHPATQENLKTLMDRGTILIEPETGRFASGLIGKGRLPDTTTLMGTMRQVLAQNGKLKGKIVLVSAGGTREAIDPVRYLTNRSSGKQGYAIAQAFLDAGANVIVVSSAQHLPTPSGANMISVQSTEDMNQAVLNHLPNVDVVIMAAAVSDYRSKTIANQKIKKGKQGDALTLNLVKNPDILLNIKAQKPSLPKPLITIGFAAESQNIVENGQGKLERKGLDLLVANDISSSEAGFAIDENIVTFIEPNAIAPYDSMSKYAVGQHIVDWVSKRFKE